MDTLKTGCVHDETNFKVPVWVMSDFNEVVKQFYLGFFFCFAARVQSSWLNDRGRRDATAHVCNQSKIWLTITIYYS